MWIIRAAIAVNPRQGEVRLGVIRLSEQDFPVQCPGLLKLTSRLVLVGQQIPDGNMVRMTGQNRTIDLDRFLAAAGPFVMPRQAQPRFQIVRRQSDRGLPQPLRFWVALGLIVKLGQVAVRVRHPDFFVDQCPVAALGKDAITGGMCFGRLLEQCRLPAAQQRPGCSWPAAALALFSGLFTHSRPIGSQARLATHRHATRLLRWQPADPDSRARLSADRSARNPAHRHRCRPGAGDRCDAAWPPARATD